MQPVMENINGIKYSLPKLPLSSARAFLFPLSSLSNPSRFPHQLDIQNASHPKMFGTRGTSEQRRAYEEYTYKELRKEEEENHVLLENAKEESDPSIATVETAKLDCTWCGKDKKLSEFMSRMLFGQQICDDCCFRYYRNREIEEKDEKSLSICEKIWCAASVPLEDLQVELMACVKRWRRYPNCRFYIQQIGHVRTTVRFGESKYNYVRCRCATKFCYECGDIPRQGRCKCNRFDCLQIFPAIWNEIYEVFYGLFCEGCFRICEELTNNPFDYAMKCEFYS